MRELENVIERAVAFEQGDVIQAESLDLGPAPMDNARRREPPPVFDADAVTADSLPSTGFHLGEHVETIERRYIAQALAKTGGRKNKAAELLGMSFRSFRYHMKKYELG